MSTVRRVQTLTRSRPTLEGAGVRLKRAVGFGDEYDFDPFLLLDDIHSTNPADYLPGFPWHPHRGIETVTYILNGTVDHGDSIGNRGSIGSGDVQWMSAGSGIIHQEMPQKTPGDFRGLQLWVNLPRSHKMSEPKYRGILAAQIPACTLPGGVVVKVIAGDFNECHGPADDIVRQPLYFDVSLTPFSNFSYPFPENHKVFAYILEGTGTFGGETSVNREDVLLFGEGAKVSAQGGGGGMRFLVFSGEPLNEPIAWRGPIVMNTDAELRLAFEELERGDFIKS